MALTRPLVAIISQLRQVKEVLKGEAFSPYGSKPWAHCEKINLWGTSRRGKNVSFLFLPPVVFPSWVVPSVGIVAAGGGVGGCGSLAGDHPGLGGSAAQMRISGHGVPYGKWPWLASRTSRRL